MDHLRGPCRGIEQLPFGRLRSRGSNDQHLGKRQGDSALDLPRRLREGRLQSQRPEFPGDAPAAPRYVGGHKRRIHRSHQRWKAPVQGRVRHVDYKCCDPFAGRLACARAPPVHQQWCRRGVARRCGGFGPDVERGEPWRRAHGHPADRRHGDWHLGRLL